MKITTESSRFFIFSLVISFALFTIVGTALYFASSPNLPLPDMENKPSGPENSSSSQPQPAVPSSAGEKPLPAPSPKSPPESGVVPKGTADEALLEYTYGGFSSSSISIIATPFNPGCLLRIINETDKPLMIRLSPHHPKDDWGVAYSLISAKNSEVIDPRYRIEKIAFHNFEKPEHEFSVTLDPVCLP